MPLAKNISFRTIAKPLDFTKHLNIFVMLTVSLTLLTFKKLSGRWADGFKWIYGVFGWGDSLAR